MATRKVIGVWPDTGSDDRNADGSYKWIISLDEIDEQDRAESTTTLAVRRDCDSAMEVARHKSAEHRCPIRQWRSDDCGGGYVDAD